MPLVDRPIIQYAVEEAVASGIEQIIIVIASGRSAIEDHFDSNPTLERWLEDRGDIEMLRAVRRISEIGHHRLRPPEGAARPGPRGPHGQGARRRRAVRRPPLRRRDAQPRRQAGDRAAHRAPTGAPRVGDRPAAGRSPTRSDATGSSTPCHEEGRLVEIRDLVEKPSIADAPSDLAVLGRYVLTPKVFDMLETTPRGAGGEIQLTDAIRALMPRAAGLRLPVRRACGTTPGPASAGSRPTSPSRSSPTWRTRCASYVRSLDLRD